MCQRARGAALVTRVGVEDHQFQITKGDQQLRWYVSSPGPSADFANTAEAPCCSAPSNGPARCISRGEQFIGQLRRRLQAAQ